ncbi:hypothetical protein Jiend_14790 [Micromonospora endophytica]|nr:hypothetical protein Jiend_14790 [Micromonospora endophytica]
MPDHEFHVEPGAGQDLERAEGIEFVKAVEDDDFYSHPPRLPDRCVMCQWHACRPEQLGSDCAATLLGAVRLVDMDVSRGGAG